MNDSLYDDVVVKRRLFGLLMVGGAVVLTVALTFLAVNLYTDKGGGQQPGQDPGSTPTVTQVPVEAAAPAAPAPTAAQPQPAIVSLGMNDFTAACQEQYGDAGAVADIAPTSDEPPSYWVKCFVDGANVGGVSLDAYCPTVAPGTRSDNPKRYDYAATTDGWLYWQCVPA
jgi:hypothetical protein